MIETVNDTKARIYAGGAYFASKKTGLDANDITVQISAGSTTTLTVHKRQSGDSCVYRGSGTGDIAAVVFYDLSPATYTVSTVDGKNFTVSNTSGVIGIAIAGKVFRSNKIGFLIQSRNHQAGDAFTISSGLIEVFSASTITAMRNLVNVGSNLISMPLPAQDVNNSYTDAANFSTTSATNLQGGSGLPAFPPTNLPIPMAFVNYREIDGGILQTVAKVYTWEGARESGKWITTDTSTPTPD